jgi:hypothetical protein
MIWEITQDVIGQNQPLTDVVGAQMMTTSGIVAERLGSLPGGLTLYDNFPNPFSAGGGSAYGGNPTTTISYHLCQGPLDSPDRGSRYSPPES